MDRKITLMCAIAVLLAMFVVFAVIEKAELVRAENFTMWDAFTMDFKENLVDRANELWNAGIREDAILKYIFRR